jgi:hypothetical protein
METCIIHLEGIPWAFDKVLDLLLLLVSCFFFHEPVKFWNIVLKCLLEANIDWDGTRLHDHDVDNAALRGYGLPPYTLSSA